MDVMTLIPRAAMLETVDITDRAAWLAGRGKHIGSSDVPGILGLYPDAWKTTPRTIWAQKTGKAASTRESWAMRQGTMMEPGIADWYAETSGLTLLPVPTVVEREAPHRSASLDRLIVSNPPGIGEIKWSGRGGWDEVPAYYFAQVQWQMALTGLGWTDIILGTPFDEPRAFRVDANPQIIEALIAKIDAFWANYVLADVEPPALTTDERLRSAIHKASGNTVEIAANDEAEALYTAIREAKERKEAAETDEAARKADLAEFLAREGAGCVIGLGWRAAPVTRAGSIDWKAAAFASGMTEADGEPFRREGSTFLDVRKMKGGK